MSNTKNESIAILGGSFLGLYSAIRIFDLGYKNITIIDKRENNREIKTNNYQLFHKNHILYIDLLNRFNIPYSSIRVKNDRILNNILQNLISKSKYIPHKNLVSQSFVVYSKSILSQYDYDILCKTINSFEEIFIKISVFDAIDIFSKDINTSLEYYKLDENITVLVSKMIRYLQNNGIKFIKNEIVDFKYNNSLFILYSKNDFHKLTYNILLCTFSKKNLLCFKFWNPDQKNLLNTVFVHNLDVSDFTNHLYFIETSKDVNKDKDIKKHILENTRLVFPQYMHFLMIKKNELYFWNTGVHNIYTRERIKNIYNNRFVLCSESYSKNNLFINHSLELFDLNFSKILKIKLISTTKST